MAWILGEYGYLSSSSSKEMIMDKLSSLCNQWSDDQTKAQVNFSYALLFVIDLICF
jgi:hypothetical protein